MLKFVYSFFLGILLVIFVGMGVASFYAAPKAPEYPKVLQEGPGSDDYTADQKAAETKYNKDNEAFGKKEKSYHRNVSIIVLAAAVVLMVLSLLLHTKITALADGLLLGGTFTLIYSIGLSFAGQNPKYSFATTSVGIAITMVVGYLKFVKPQQAAPAKKK